MSKCYNGYMVNNNNTMPNRNKLCISMFSYLNLVKFKQNYNLILKFIIFVCDLLTKIMNLTFDGVFFTLIVDGGGLILSTLFPFVKTIEKVNF